MEPFAQTINAGKNYVGSSTRERVDWNAEPLTGAMAAAAQELTTAAGRGLW